MTNHNVDVPLCINEWQFWSECGFGAAAALERVLQDRWRSRMWEAGRDKNPSALLRIDLDYSACEL